MGSQANRCAGFIPLEKEYKMSPRLRGILFFYALVLLLFCKESLGNVIEANAAFERGDYSIAKKLYLREKNSVAAQINLAKIFMSTDIEKAEKWVDKALGQEKKNAEAHYLKGLILGKQAEESTFSGISLARKAKGSFETALSLDEENTSYIDALIKFHTRAPSIAGGDKGTAMHLLDKLEKIDRKTAYKARFEFFKETDNTLEAENVLEKAQKMFPDSPFLNFISLYISCILQVIM